MAGRLRRLYGKRLPTQSSLPLHRTTSGASSHAHVSQGVPGTATPQWRGIRRTLRLIRRPCWGWVPFLWATGGCNHRLMSDDPFGIERCATRCTERSVLTEERHLSTLLANIHRKILDKVVVVGKGSAKVNASLPLHGNHH